jgi:hypothetical protein
MLCFFASFLVFSNVCGMVVLWLGDTVFKGRWAFFSSPFQSTLSIQHEFCVLVCEIESPTTDTMFIHLL